MLQDFFTEDSLNIFTDASMNSYGNCACTGVCPVYGKIDKRFPLLNTSINTRVIKNCTNNFAEGRAIIDAIYIAAVNKDKFNTIRIISDSQISIYGIRDRIVKWKTSKKKDKDGFVNFVGSQGYIKNQDIFLEALYTILDYNLSIEFLHQAGHVSMINTDSLMKSAETFKRSNGILDDLDIELLRSLAFYNNYVDRNSRDVLYSTDIYSLKTYFPFKYKVYEGYDKSTYARLVNPENSIFTKEVKK